MIRGAILGAGNVAINGHVPGWLARSDVEIVAAADPRPAARAAILERLPEARWYGSAEELLAGEDLDFADICAPPAMHAGLIATCLERGLHVLCEKPLVLSREELEPLASLAASQKRVLATVHNWRHAPLLAAAREFLDSGQLGEIVSCRWETLRQKPAAAAAEGGVNWRVDPAIAGGGVLMDHGWHAIYVLCGWLPGPPARVSGILSTRRHHDFPLEDTAELRLETGGTARAEIFVTWAADERRNRAAIEGTLGAVRLDGHVLDLVPRGSTRPSRRREFPQGLSEGSHHPEWFAGVAREFLAEIANPGGESRTLEEAFLCLDVIAKARESSRRQGALVSLERGAGAAPIERQRRATP
jgi:predicted dehydrogenase